MNKQVASPEQEYNLWKLWKHNQNKKKPRLRPESTVTIKFLLGGLKNVLNYQEKKTTKQNSKPDDSGEMTSFKEQKEKKLKKNEQN